MKSEDFLSRVHEQQLKLLEKIRSISSEGEYVDYLGKKLKLFPNVFIPHEDSHPIVKGLGDLTGKSVLDLCTGSGVVAIFAAYAGASRVVACDINPSAIKAAKINSEEHEFSDIIEVKQSDLFAEIGQEKFDLITINIPFRNKEASDLVEASLWDTNLNTHRRFFEGLPEHLKENGRAIISQANFGALEEMKEIAANSGFKTKLLGTAERVGIPDIEFYAFEITRA